MHRKDAGYSCMNDIKIISSVLDLIPFLRDKDGDRFQQSHMIMPFGDGNAIFDRDANMIAYADANGIHISCNLDLSRCKSLQSLGNLSSVSGNLYLSYCNMLSSLGNLSSVSGNLGLYYCESLQSLGHLRSVSGGLDLYGCEMLASLGNLRSVSGKIYGINGCKLINRDAMPSNLKERIAKL